MSANLMRTGKIAKRYAGALFDAAQDNKQTEVINEQLRILATLLENQEGFRQFLLDKHLAAAEKKALIRDVFAPSFSPLLVNYLYLLIDKNREDILVPSIFVFDELWLEYLGIVSIRLTTAKTLCASLEKQLSDALKKALNKEIIFKYDIDPSLIGGAVMQIGDITLDGSIKSKLANIHKQIAEAVSPK